MQAIRSQVRPWAVRGPRVSAAMRKARARVPRMYLANIPISRPVRHRTFHD